MSGFFAKPILAGASDNNFDFNIIYVRDFHAVISFTSPIKHYLNSAVPEVDESQGLQQVREWRPCGRSAMYEGKEAGMSMEYSVRFVFQRKE
jgi:hypothetical protein